MGIIQNSYKFKGKYYIHKRNIAAKSNVSGNMYTISFDNDFKGKFNEDSYVNIQNVLSYAANNVRNPMFSFNNSFEGCTISNDSVIGNYSHMNITSSENMFKDITLSDNFNTKEFVNKDNVIQQTLMPSSIELNTNCIEFNKDHDVEETTINFYDLVSISSTSYYDFDKNIENRAKLLKDIVSYNSIKGSHKSYISIVPIDTGDIEINYTPETDNAIPDKTYAYIIYNNKKSILEIKVTEDKKYPAFSYSYVKMLEQPAYVRILEQPSYTYVKIVEQPAYSYSYVTIGGQPKTMISGSVRIIEY